VQRKFNNFSYFFIVFPFFSFDWDWFLVVYLNFKLNGEQGMQNIGRIQIGIRSSPGFINSKENIKERNKAKGLRQK